MAKLLLLLGTQIMEFFEAMGMKLPVKPPLMMVDSTALNSAEEREALPTDGAGGRGGRRGGGPVFHTRGLTLTQVNIIFACQLACLR